LPRILKEMCFEVRIGSSFLNLLQAAQQRAAIAWSHHHQPKTCLPDSKRWLPHQVGWKILSPLTAFTHHYFPPLHQSYSRKQQVWLPVRQRIEFNTALLAYKCVYGLAPSYLAAFCQVSSDHPGRSRLPSADLYQLHVPRIRRNLGDGIFSVNGPVVWNSLPVNLWAPDMLLDTFKRQLKTVLFKSVYW